ncbi:unnamed protein product [Effrenium voratum]|uniref:Potassium channel domain-containing protein n=1 Tax=Effrenium voratum TaxID=2562239 RepID=A0AA36I8U6_9DINO|nr:unnamed protein product [Effrenium voratum]CAJ1453771.1 unnamed protein product [Effrenium voratum]
MFWRAVAVISVIAWVLGGALFYYLVENCKTEVYCTGLVVENCGWTFGQSFYYSVQTGLSIGFGLLSESKDTSRLYSVFHILAGSSVIAGCLSWFASATLERHSHSRDNSERELARFAHACHTDGYDGFSVIQMRDLLAKYPQFTADLVYKLDQDDEKVTEYMDKFRMARIKDRQNMAIQLLTRAHNELQLFEKSHDKLNIDDTIMKMHKDSGTYLSIAGNVFQRNQSAIITWAGWLIWIALGIIVSTSQCNWSFVEGLYFSVAALSTAGLQATCDGADDKVIFVALYCLIGVPLFGVALGRLAGVIVDRHMEKWNRKKMQERISTSEVLFAQHILNHAPDSKITLSEFVQIQLLRTGAVDREMLESLKEDFQRLSEGKSFITRDVAMKGHEHQVHKHKPEVVNTEV